MQAVKLLVTLALLASALAQTADSTEANQWGGSGGWNGGGWPVEDSSEEGYPNYQNLGLYDWNPCQNEQFDFIVVGAGAAGSVVAARLAQSNQNYRILLLEAGGPSQRDLGGRDYVQSSFVNISGVLHVGQPFTRYDVPGYYPTIGNSPALANYEYNIPGVQLAKIVGGGMAHNGLVWARPTPYNLNNWNVTGWDWNSYLPYLIKSENVTGTTSATVDPSLRGLAGPIKISDPPFRFLNDYALTNSCLALGEPFNADPNGATREGCGLLQQNSRRGVRSSSALEYLRPQLVSNPRIKARIYATVSRVTFTTVNGKQVATGVEYFLPNGYKYTAQASREVILSAGALNTPKILILSGIGPAATLQKYRIPVVKVNENVGLHLRNQRLTPVIFNWSNPIEPNIYSIFVNSLEYATYGTGFLAQGAVPGEIFNFKTTTGLTDPDITVLGDWGYDSPVTNPFRFVLTVWTSNPAGADGTVTINTTDPFALPIVNQNLLSNADDLAALARGVQKVRQMMNTPIAKSFFHVTELVPGPAVQTNAQFNTYLRTPGNVGGAYHYIGTARMGNAGDTTAVVDPHLRVNGVQNLRVIDGSICTGPLFFGAQAGIVGIAEKGVATILADELAASK